MLRFEGKVALVTGAASGIARATCERLASEGGAIFGIDVNGDGLAETEAIIKDAGGTIQVGVFDVTSREECHQAVQATLDAFSRLDILINVAGIVRFRKFLEMSEEEWKLVHAVNLDGPFFLCQAAIPHLLETSGNIVNVASNAGLMGQAYTSSYCSSKGALVQLTRSIAMEFLKSQIRVNAIAPGGVLTNLAHGIEFPDELDMDLMQRFMSPRGMSDATEIAGAIAYLASDEAKSVHGTIFSIDQGVTAG